MTHLLKLDYSSPDWPRNHWRREILAFRQSLERRLTPSLRQAVLESFDKRYANARESASADLLETEPGIRRRLPAANPYDWDAIEHHEDVRVVVAEGEGAMDTPKRRGKRKA